MTDFDNWLRWYRAQHDPSITQERARQAYDEYYFCDCESCVLRKERGFQPMHIGPHCKLPTNRPPLAV